jgi:hypothetical protein
MALGELEGVSLSEPHLAPKLFISYARVAGFNISPETVMPWTVYGKNDAKPEDVESFLISFIGSLSTFHQRLMQYYLHVFRQVRPRLPAKPAGLSSISLLSAKVALRADVNKMNARNIATVIAPAFLKPEAQSNPAALKYAFLVSLLFFPSRSYLCSNVIGILAALIETERPTMFSLPINKIIATADDEWEDYPPEVLAHASISQLINVMKLAHCVQISVALENSFQLRLQEHNIIINNIHYRGILHPFELRSVYLHALLSPPPPTMCLNAYNTSSSIRYASANPRQ